MSPSIAFIKFLIDDISNDRFHDAYERLPEAMQLIRKMSIEEEEFCIHTIKGARKVYTQAFHRFNQFVESKSSKIPQLNAVVNFLSYSFTGCHLR